MKERDQIVEFLNKILTTELTAINQYFIHAKMCENWGYMRLWKKLRAESLDEMNHAEKLIERILYLEGLPNIQRIGKVAVGETVPEQIRLNLDLELSAAQALNQGIELCASLSDNGSRELLKELLEGVEQSINWHESQLSLINQVGEANYLAQQIPE